MVQAGADVVRLAGGGASFSAFPDAFQPVAHVFENPAQISSDPGVRTWSVHGRGEDLHRLAAGRFLPLQRAMQPRPCRSCAKKDPREAGLG